MPFKSDKQRRYLYANKPEVAKKFAEEEKKMSLYENINKRKKAGTSRSKKDSTISDEAYANMKAGFPKKKKKKKKYNDAEKKRALEKMTSND